MNERCDEKKNNISGNIGAKVRKRLLSKPLPPYINKFLMNIKPKSDRVVKKTSAHDFSEDVYTCGTK